MSLNRGLVMALLVSLAPGVGALDLLKEGQKFFDSFSADPKELSVGEIAGGLKDALRVGTQSVVGQLGADDGFSKDPAIHIPLPESMQTVQSALSKLGMSGLLDDLELRLNRAAETATPKAKDLFWDAIGAMTLEDVNAIYEGPDDSATRYFQGKM